VTDESGFLLAILADPADPALRLIYADWLEERGDPASASRAEYLRIRCELDRLPSEDQKRRQLQTRLLQLRETVGDEWWRQLDWPKSDKTQKGRAVVMWEASVRSDRPLVVGCFCTVALRHELREAFGPDVECDETNLLAGHAERTARTAAELGIRPDSPVVLTAARDEVQFGPRHAFRLRVGPGAFVCGTLDRYSIRVQCEREEDFPEPARGRFLAFLASLRLGRVRVDRV
jgi:uncharacterized protein (TIGR02996 family)